MKEIGVVSQMPGAGFTMAAFDQNEVPVGTKLYSDKDVLYILGQIASWTEDAQTMRYAEELIERIKK